MTLSTLEAVLMRVRETGFAMGMRGDHPAA